MTGITALLPVRDGTLPLGGLEAVAEATTGCWLVGNSSATPSDELLGLTNLITAIEAATFAPGFWAEQLAPALPADDHLLLPSSPDGRDLAPRLAATLGRPLVTGVTKLTADRAVVTRRGGLTMETIALVEPIVATLQVDGFEPLADAQVLEAGIDLRRRVMPPIDDERYPREARLLEVIEADPATMDLAEASRIVAGGAGLATAENFAELYEIAERLGASTGATRVVTDWGWAPIERQIGTTGVLVNPELYLAVGISGAIQHTAGLGSPEHVIVVNTDPSCPMMDLADLGIVCDGPAFLQALSGRLARLSQTSSTR